jgi:uncharacterized membrane protein YphA (DoxX/SURF4 family)
MKLLFLLLSFLVSTTASAHVKWFSSFDFKQRPLTFQELNHSVFWGLFLLSIITIALFVYLDKLAEKSAIYHRINTFLDRYAEQGPLIMRVAMGAVLLMSWQGDTVIAPEIAIQNPIWGWFQFTLALLLLFKETTPLVGLGILFLYFKGIDAHGFFHMLDYVVYPSVGLFLILSYSKIEKLKNLDLPVLYSGLGFSLCWVAFEKMIYPYWGISVLSQAPALMMGLKPDFFLLSCAFVEFSLGYLLIICLLHRPLAIVVTLTFFTTTAFFGKPEIIGHTILHGALLVFIVKGPGRYYPAPIRFHKNLALRYLFSAVNFVLLFVILAIPYQNLSQQAYAEAQVKAKLESHGIYHVASPELIPEVMLHAFQDVNGGWNLHLMTKNFKFTPENSGKSDVPGEGHAHLFLNGKKIARIYGNWFHTSLPKGKNTIKVNLTTNSHKDYYIQDKPIESQTDVEESRESKSQHHH